MRIGILIFFYLILVSCKDQNASQKNPVDSCLTFKELQSENGLLKAKNGFVDFIILDVVISEKIHKVKLQMNRKPIPRVQILSFIETQKEIPQEWRNLAGGEPSELIQFFESQYKVQSKEVHFIEFPGFGGRKISWKKTQGEITCIGI